MNLDFQKDMRIDELALDVEWLRQGELAQEYNRYFSKIKRQCEIKHEELKTRRSELIRKATKNPKKCCFTDKKEPTKDQIEAYYRTHKDYKAIKSELIDLEHEVRMAELAKNEINFTKKAALENLIELLKQNYFAGPKSPRDLTMERRLAEKERSKRVNKRMTMKKRKGGKK